VLVKIILGNLRHKPLHTTLSVALLALSTGIIALLLSMQTQIEQKLERDLQEIDLVLGAKGSPLQLVLSAVYHLDAPTGNISMAEVEKVKKHPMVKQTIPLAYGDSYASFRIVGTDSSYLHKYEAKLKNGRLFQDDLEVVVGAAVAAKTGLKLGQTFHSTHGEAEQGEIHEHHDYVVVGILEATNTVLDQLVLCTVSSVWAIHQPHDTESELASEHAGHDHEEHDHEGHEEHDHEGSQEELTALLVKFRSPMGIMTVPRMINETTQMQAAVPALEINRLMGLMGIGTAALQALALAILVISGFSVFITLYNRLKERRYELALLRSLGCGKGQLFFLLVSEGFLLAALGFAGGQLLSKIGLAYVNQASNEFHFSFHYNWTPSEGWVLLGSLLVGILAALLPAWKAYQMDVSAVLADPS
jgi:putative ABC transport system permease protein